MDERVEYDGRDSFLLLDFIEICGRVKAILCEDDAELGADERSVVAVGNFIQHS